VTAGYDPATDKITLTSTTTGSPIVLGSAADTSNFLQIAQLYNNGGDAVTSASALGHAKITAAMTNPDGTDNAGLATPVTDGGSGAGAFTINGVTINYDAGTDAIQDVLNRINSSSAGVTASYDPLNNQFVMANKVTGDIGISMQDVTGNFLAATGLSNGTLQHGQNLLYTLNDNPQPLVSQTNNITAASSGIQGVTVTAQNTGSATVTVGVDTTTISNTIKKLVTDYSAVQSYITSQMSVNTGSDSSVSAGTLTGDQNANDIANSLRSLMSVVSSVVGAPGTVKQLADLGFQSNGQNKGVSLSDASALDDALTNHLSDVKTLFTDATNGLATKLDAYLNATIGDNGTLTSHQASLTQRSKDINTQISNLENKITQDSNQWTAEFQAMEQAQSQVNQQLTYLSQAVSGGSL
jgi:flagellar hook-associated protein 2